MATTDLLFYLIPETLQAASIVEANQTFQYYFSSGTKVLAIPFTFKSKIVRPFGIFWQSQLPRCHPPL